MKKISLSIFVLVLPFIFLIFVTVLPLFSNIVQVSVKKAWYALGISALPILIVFVISMWSLLYEYVFGKKRHVAMLCIIVISALLSLWGVIIHIRSSSGQDDTMFRSQYPLHTVQRLLQDDGYIYTWQQYVSNDTTYAIFSYDKKPISVIAKNMNFTYEFSSDWYFFGAFPLYFFQAGYNTVFSDWQVVLLFIVLGILMATIGIVPLYFATGIMRLLFLINAYGILNIVFIMVVSRAWVVMSIGGFLSIAMILSIIVMHSQSMFFDDAVIRREAETQTATVERDTS